MGRRSYYYGQKLEKYNRIIAGEVQAVTQIVLSGFGQCSGRGIIQGYLNTTVNLHVFNHIVVLSAKVIYD